MTGIPATVQDSTATLSLSGDDLTAFRAAARSWRLAGAAAAGEPRPLTPS